MFEEAVWEVGFVLQKSAGLSELGAYRGEYVKNVIQTLVGSSVSSPKFHPTAV